MQKLLLAFLMTCSSAVLAAPLDSVFKEHSGHTRHKAPAFDLKEDDQPNPGFGVTLKHEEFRNKKSSAGLVKAVPILPVNAVMSTFTFSIL